MEVKDSSYESLPNNYKIFCKACNEQLMTMSVIKNFDFLSKSKTTRYVVINSSQRKNGSSIKQATDLTAKEADIRGKLPDKLGLLNDVKVVQSSNSDDRYCSYKEIECISCSKVVGRVYLSTNFVIDPVLNEPLLYSDSIVVSNESNVEQSMKKFSASKLVLTPYKEKNIEYRSIAKGTISDIKRPPVEHNDGINADNFKGDNTAKKMEELDYLKNKQNQELNQFRDTIIDLADIIQELDLRARTSLYEVEKMKEYVYKLSEKLDK